ncbi:MAG: hypothetical protein GY833_25350, partial [Aestuariibacter sp.]|nr:hypothetical protein [Aestuariibacter sp.]
ALERTHLPDLIRQVVWQRLAHLSPTAQRVLQWAAVLGPVFWDGAVEVIGQVPREQVEAALQESIDQELIVERQACALAGQREYLFTNPTVREVNFESFPADLLQDAHRQTAAWLIAHGEEQIGEYLGQIAEHLERAGETELAVIYLCQAGEQSAAQFANAEATGCFGRALRLTPQDDLETRYLLLRKREKVYGH